MSADKELKEQIDILTRAQVDNSEIQALVQEIIDATNALSKEERIELLIQAVSFIDLTSLKGDETTEDIKKLCKKTECKTLVEDETVYTAAICVYPRNVPDAIDTLKEMNVRDKVAIATVSGDFPAGKLPLEQRIEEIKFAAALLIDEIDVVINRQLALEDKWQLLYDELNEMHKACGDKKMKTILATGELKDKNHIYIASMVSILAGTDFIKTSTGKETTNATLAAGVVMARAITDFHSSNKDKKKVGLKPAGGIVTAEEVLQWMVLVQRQLGKEWCNKDLFRIGASRALDNIIEEVYRLKLEK